MSFYSLRQAARSAQNTLLDQPHELIAIRNATTTDTWGPSSVELDAVVNECYTSSLTRVVFLLMERAKEYSQAGRQAVTRRSSMMEQLYKSAVHYLNSGSEWRIVYKCMRVLEHLIVVFGDDAVQPAMEHLTSIERIRDQYESLREQANQTTDEETMTTAQLQRVEQMTIVTQQANRVCKLIKDEDFRAKETELSMKVMDKIGGVGNDAVVVKQKPKDGLAFEKTLDRHKLTHSNMKAEAKNKIGHIIHTKERLPGVYTPFDEYSSHTTTADSVFDSDDGMVDDEGNGL